MRAGGRGTSTGARGGDAPSRHGRHHVVTALVEEDGDARITLTGHLGGDAVDGLADELAAVLRNADRVTVDLDGLSTPDPAALGVLATALDRAGGWPAAKLGLVAHDPHTCQALQTTGIARLVAVATDQDAARACSDHRPADARADWHLPAALASPHQARQLVEMRLYSWASRPTPGAASYGSPANSSATPSSTPSPR